VSSSLTVPVRWFVDDVSAALHQLGKTTDEGDEGPRRDAATEAFNLTCGFIDADGLHTDEELWALTGAFGPLLPTQIKFCKAYAKDWPELEPDVDKVAGLVEKRFEQANQTIETMVPGGRGSA